jgi:hypothetical protein
VGEEGGDSGSGDVYAGAGVGSVQTCIRWWEANGKITSSILKFRGSGTFWVSRYLVDKREVFLATR